MRGCRFLRGVSPSPISGLPSIAGNVAHISLLDDEFLTVAEVAHLLKLNQQTVRTWIDQAYLPAIRVGRRVRIRRSGLDELLAKSAVRPQRRQHLAAQAFWDGEVPKPQSEPAGPE
jgi:excisionase family DNA binding protein